MDDLGRLAAPIRYHGRSVGAVAEIIEALDALINRPRWAIVSGMTVALFIDANQYLKLYGVVAGRKLLDSLDEWRGHIFLARQIVDEVLRNKLGCATTFFASQFKEIGAITVPDHMLGIDPKKAAELRATFQAVTKSRNELGKLAAEFLERISRSDDDVSARLKPLFDTAAAPSEDELRRAKARKEVGTPPGKADDPLGDQIVWEQLLTHCRDLKIKRLWLVTEDSDYVVVYAGNVTAVRLTIE